MEYKTFSKNELPSFSKHLVSILNFLPETSFTTLREDVLGMVNSERSFIPSHKKGGTVAYDTLRKTHSKAVELYTSNEYRHILERVVGETLFQTPFSDQSSLSVLFYDKPGDHIGWHYDYNFYNGRHFTVLLSLENTNAAGTDVSASTLLAKQNDSVVTVPTPQNTLVMFEGAKIFHRATKLKEGEKRVILSMTYTTNPKNSFVLEAMRRIKDTAYIGPRALWT